MKTIIERILAAYYDRSESTMGDPTDLFLGRKDYEELCAEKIPLAVSRSDVTGMPKLSQFAGMAVHKTEDETLIAVGWKGVDP